MMDRYTAEVGKENAAWLAGSPPLDTTTAFAGAFTSNGDGTVTFSHDVLVALRDLPEDCDGHVDPHRADVDRGHRVPGSAPGRCVMRFGPGLPVLHSATCSECGRGTVVSSLCARPDLCYRCFLAWLGSDGA